MPSVFRVAALVTSSAGVLSAVLVSQRDRFKAYATSKQPEEPAPISSWNSNWDKREQLNVGKSKGDSEGSEVDSKPKATRVLVLIRHGQYETWHEDREKRVLTALGKEQAMLTSQRLKQLNENYDIIHYSTMPRAVETAQFVAKTFPDVLTKPTDLLREGAPIRPNPPSQRWKPEEYVSRPFLYSMQCVCFKLYSNSTYWRSFSVTVLVLKQPSGSSSIGLHPHRRTSLSKCWYAMPM